MDIDGRYDREKDICRELPAKASIEFYQRLRTIKNLKVVVQYTRTLYCIYETNVNNGLEDVP